MIRRVFHAWERRLASTTRDRVVRPFEWGAEWIPCNGHRPGTPERTIVSGWVEAVMADTERFFEVPPRTDFRFTPGSNSNGEAGTLTFESAFRSPHAENNRVHARYFPSRPFRPFPSSRARRADVNVRPYKLDVGPAGTTARGGRTSPPTGRRAVLVLPHWNADPSGHVGLCRLLTRFGLSVLRLSLPYHDHRMPPELRRADYIVSANVARTLQVCRQAVVDARLAIRWLAEHGYERIGILGTSLGSCLALLTAAHEPLIRAQALNHISPFFADVVWEGLSTAHVRAGLEGHIELDELRDLWRPISPQSYLERVRDKQTLLVYARYDLTFPVGLSLSLVEEFRRRSISHQVAVLPCGHYTTGIAPFKYLDGLMLARFLDQALWPRVAQHR